MPPGDEFQSGFGRGLRAKIIQKLTTSWQKERAHPALVPLGKLYGWLAWGRRRFYQASKRSQKASKPVISLGNLTVGGTGKTPMCLALARLLLEQNLIPAVLTRGYGRNKNSPPPPLVVSRGYGPEVPVEQSGDEAGLMAQQLPELRVVVDPCRTRGARMAVDQLGADILLLDDGFQHLNLEADCRILLIPAANPFGNRAMLPAGPLREPLAAHKLAHILISVGQTEPTPLVLELASGRPVFAAKYDFWGWQPLAGGHLWPLEALKGRRVLAFCGLGRPDSFKGSLEELGLDLRRFVALADHQVYSPNLLHDLGLAYLASGAEFMVTTSKDAVKIPPDFPLPILVLDGKMALTRPNDFLETVLHFAQPRFNKN